MLRTVAKTPTIARLTALSLTLALALWSCSSDDTGTTPDVTVTVTLTPTSATLFVGGTAVLTATVTGSSATATFSSSNSGVASVTGGGTVTAVSPGTATITANVGTASATAQVLVNASSISLDVTDAEIEVGATVQLTATVTGGTGHTVSWGSSSTGVATVDGDGLVTGVAVGNATITASVDGQSGVQTTSTISVTDRAPTITLDQVTQNGQAVDPNSVSGVIDIQVTVDAPASFTGRVEAVLDGVVIGSADFPPAAGAAARAVASSGAGAPPVSLTVSGNLRTVSNIDGEIVEQLPNGNRGLLNVLLLEPGGDELTRATGESDYELDNDPLMFLDAFAFDGPSAPGPGGSEWKSGNGRFRATVITFDATTIVDNIGIDVRLDPGPAFISFNQVITQTVTLDLDATLPPPSGIGDFEGTMTFSGATITESGGSPFGIDIANNDFAFRDEFIALVDLDNKGPSSSKDLEYEPFWANDELEFRGRFSTDFGFRWESDANGPPTVTEGGSGLAGCRIQAGSSPGSSDLGDDVQIGVDLFETLELSVFLQVLCNDFNGNTTAFQGVDPVTKSPAGVGFDFTDPFGSILDSPPLLSDVEINPLPGDEWFFSITDPPNSAGGSSGADFEEAVARALRALADLDDEDACVTGDHVDGVCVGVPFALSGGHFQVQADWTSSGKYRAEISPKDKAGNVGDPTIFWFFQDVEDPETFDLLGPAPFQAGVPGTFSAKATDDVSLWQAEFSVEYESGFPFRIGAPRTEFDPFGDGVTSTADAIAEFNYYRSFETVGPPSFPNPTGDIFGVHEMYAGVRDVGRNWTGAVADITGNADEATESFGATGQDWFEISLTNTQICDPTRGGSCGSTPTSTTAEVFGFIPNNGNTIDITDLRFFSIITGIDGEDTAVPIGDQPAVLTVTDYFGSFMQYDWILQLLAEDMPPCTKAVVAIGADETGAALVTNQLPFDLLPAQPITDTSAFATCP